MATVTIHTAEAQLSLLLARVEAGEEIIIARGTDPIAKLVPFGPPVPKSTGKRQFGALRGKLSIGPEFFEPLPDEELGNWES
jgi:prevent-host-death family protein